MEKSQNATLTIALNMLKRIEGRPLACFALGAVCGAAWRDGKEPPITALWMAEDVYDEDGLRDLLDPESDNSDT
ncbi:MAG TPA: hypothetical protein VE998_06370 [Terriglobales bacterium]|nr:hypothetical protein [Terriglobales bacterium]